MKHAQHKLPLPQPIPLCVQTGILTEHAHIEGRAYYYYIIIITIIIVVVAILIIALDK